MFHLEKNKEFKQITLGKIEGTLDDRKPKQISDRPVNGKICLSKNNEILVTEYGINFIWVNSGITR